MVDRNRLRWLILSLLPLISEGGRISQESAPAACTFPSTGPVHLAVSSDASVDTLIYRSTVSPPQAEISISSVTSTKLPHINYTNRFEVVKDANGEFEIRTKGRLSLPPYPSEITSANLYLSVTCNEQVFPLLTLRLDGGNRVAPRFYGLPYEVSLPRKSPVGTEVNTGIIAIDWDPALAYGVHFSILDDWAPFSLVVRPVSSSSPSLSLPLSGWATDQFPPQIRLKVMGSIEHLPNEFNLTISAIDSGEPAKSNSTKIHVNLLGEYRPLVRESRVRTVIGEAKKGDTLLVIPSIVSVVDEEIGPVTYSFVERKMKEYFSIDPSTAALTLLSHPPLSIKSFGIMVTSSENPPRSSIIEINLQRDGQFPRFSSCDFSVSLPENSKPGTHVFQMHIIDRSEDTNIRLIDPDDTFSLDIETGIVTVNDPTVLDLERFDFVQFVIEIQSLSSFSSIPPNVCQKARVTVHLIDENDNSPLFDQTQYKIRVLSPLPNNTLLRSIKAIDADKDDNGRVDYKLLDADGLPIRLVSVNGSAELIYSQRPNTRPLIGRYYVTLEAIDHGQPQRFSRAIIEIEADDLSGLDEELERKLRDEDREKKKVAKTADHSKKEGSTNQTTEEPTTVSTTKKAKSSSAEAVTKATKSEGKTTKKASSAESISETKKTTKSTVKTTKKSSSAEEKSTTKEPVQTVTTTKSVSTAKSTSKVTKKTTATSLPVDIVAGSEEVDASLEEEEEKEMTRPTPTATKPATATNKKVSPTASSAATANKKTPAATAAAKHATAAGPPLNITTKKIEKGREFVEEIEEEEEKEEETTVKNVRKPKSEEKKSTTKPTAHNVKRVKSEEQREVVEAVKSLRRAKSEEKLEHTTVVSPRKVKSREETEESAVAPSKKVKSEERKEEVKPTVATFVKSEEVEEEPEEPIVKKEEKKVEAKNESIKRVIEGEEEEEWTEENLDGEKKDRSDTQEEIEVVSRFHRDQKIAAERKIFSFIDPLYMFDLFGEFREGEALGRVVATPDALLYAMEKKALPYFKVDSDTGEIAVHSSAADLDGPFKFTVSSTNGMVTTEALVSVRIDKTRSISDSSPSFDQSVYTIHLKENVEPKPITTLRAFHRGLLDGSSTLIYSLLDDGTNVPFYLDERSAQLVLLAPLDYEKEKTIDFKVSACLSSNPSSCDFSVVRIIVDDVNDNAPVLKQREIAVKLPSDLPKGSPVARFKATDKDSKENGEISYAINPPSNTFAIDIDTGEVITLGVLENAHYEMAIQAFDHGSPRRSDIGRLTVQVLGTNPSAPQFDQFRYDVTLSGPVKSGERVVTLHASDPDPGEEGIVSYRFATPKNAKDTRDQSRFSMNPHTGAVTTLTPLNSFDGPFLFVVEAVDHSKEFPRKAETLLRIRVEGEPALRFFALPSTLFISSSKPNGSVILRASASSSEGTPITFSLNPLSSSFSMNGPNLVVVGSLEPKEYDITIRAETQGTFINHSLHIVVMTNRDKYPVFPRLIFDLPVSLDGSFPSTLHTFQAQVQTGSVEYSLFPPKNIPAGVTIDKHSGELRVTEEFLSSTANTDTVFTVVRAWNSEYPQFHSDVGVILSIEAPTTPFAFPLTLYRAIVAENTPVGTMLNSSVAMAPKSQRTGVEYGITPSDIIGINSQGALFVAAPIDLEALPVDEEGTLTYTIWAESGDERAVSTMRVKVTNVNEFTPAFRSKIFRFNVDESATPGTVLGRIVADDGDFGDKLIYSMKSDSRASSIEITPRGEVVIGKGGIDFDSERAFDLVVSVEDSTGRSDEATVEVVIIPDESGVRRVDNDSPLVWNVSGDSPAALPINAVDAGEKEIRYEIVAGNEQGLFQLEKVNRTAVLLKPQTALPAPSSFTLIVNAIDSTKISSSRVIVNVLPPTTQPPTTSTSASSSTTDPPSPIFNQLEYSKALKDDTPVGTALISVQVWSPPKDGPISLSSNCSFLNVLRNGVVLLSTPLPLQSGEIECGITASTRAGANTAPFHILILDSSVSNHAPIFDRPFYNFSISGDSFASMIGRIGVQDMDGDEVTLEIQPPEYRQIFEINEQNELELRFPASTLTDQNNFSFIIVATDNGEPKQTSIANVKVFVANSGGKKGGFFPIASSASTNSLISPIPTSLTSLSTPNSSDEKTIEPIEVTTQGVELVTNDFTTPLPHEPENTSDRVITTGELNGVSTETIENGVEPTEDEKLRDPTTTRPKGGMTFSQNEYKFAVRKIDLVGSIIGSVKVTGIDDVSSLEFMTGDERVVRVDETGAVILTGPVIPSPYKTPVIMLQEGRILAEAQLVIEYKETTILPTPTPTTIQSTSRPSTSPSSTTLPTTTSSPPPTLRVQGGTTPLDIPSVTPSSSISPSTSAVPPLAFSASHYTASIPEGAYESGAIVQLKPGKIQTNGRDVTYALENSEEVPFVINESTGELAIFSVDREEKSEYELIVKAFDHSSNEEASAVIHVEILDENDSYPVFVSLPPIIGVRRDAAVGSVIGHISAKDADAGSNGAITYSIEPSQYLAVDQKTGSIIVRASLMSISHDQMTMTVRAKDGGEPANSVEERMELRLFSAILSPTLPRSSSFSLPANSTFIAHLLAAPNSGTKDNSITYYTIDNSSSGLFTIDENGVLSVGRAPKPEEMNVEHRLKITAKNGYGVDATEMRVTLIDPSSTSSPTWIGGSSTIESICMFPIREYKGEVKENLPPGTPVIKVTSDCEAKRERVKYTIAVHSADFTVDADNGEIRTLRRLDREEKAIHLLVVNVTRDISRRSERGTEAEESLEALRSRLSVSQTVVIIRVVDENDSTPEWNHLNKDGKIVATMDWKTPVGSPLLRIHASDKDEKKTRLRYSIEGDVMPFSINETTGLIYLNNSVEKETTDMYSLTGMVTDGAHENRVQIEIYRLSTQHHLVRLVSDLRHVDIDAKKLEEEINSRTDLNLHVLSKQPYVDKDGNVDPKKSYLFVYSLDEKNVPKRAHELLESLAQHSAVLYQTSGKISSFSSAQSPITLSLANLICILVGVILVVLLFIVCCILCTVSKRRRLRELEKQYMVDGMRPRPYDVENIPRSTAQTVLASRRIADAIPDDDRMSRTSNRSDTTFVFANSIKDENSLRRSLGRSAKVQDSTQA